ncbi:MULTISPECIES: hypothetical protein [Prochlorococcus]|uniref:hypothetical protein n=1 Tax=Prochlorococcus TaxID=1218 RepID=UPI0007B32B76|nr:MULTISPECIES: hypothetical protein [Prochlorococcus]KZR67255.1 hypothetical protein PMIT1312_00546 [Prochlorococcus marinus str. MIT 1312]NMO83787.1 hypothetical protein [Prochlorococcus sp. P1344]NMP12434.1 hypothetical protein [Prochlorococcus sp.P1363]
MARKPSKHAFKVNGQTIRPKKNLGGRKGRLTGAAEVQRVSELVDRYEAELQQGLYGDQGWEAFRDDGGLLGDVLRAKGLI